jgi:hypothetical protein
MRKPFLVMATLSVTNVSSAIAQHHHDTRADSIVAVAKWAIRPFTDAGTLRLSGWNAIGFGGGVKDLSPFQGQHWISGPRFIASIPIDLRQPSFLMYLAVGDSLIPVGVAYTLRMAADAVIPDSLAGAAAEWHTHVMCRQVPGEGTVLADGVADCAQRGGSAAPNKIAMIHTWTVSNPDGPYAHDNPALPFLATGLRAPESATRADRQFAVALGETYGAKLFIAHRIERDLRRQSTSHEGLTKLEELRAPLRDLVPQLRDAERSRDPKKFAALRRKLIEGYGALADQYKALALTPEIKARFDYELKQALERTHKHM